MRALIGETLRRNRLLGVLGIAHLVFFLLLIPAVILDPSQILGINRWLKPLKFAISIGIFMVTMGWLLSYLEKRRAVSVISRIIAVTLTAEMIFITMQSVRGVRSHFNQDSLFDGLVFTTMGLLILINTIAAAYAWVLFLRGPTTIRGAHLSGVRLGLIIFVMASLIGA